MRGSLEQRRADHDQLTGEGDEAIISAYARYLPKKQADAIFRRRDDVRIERDAAHGDAA